MPQNMLTEPDIDLPDGEELPALTAQQQKFVEGIVGGKTASDAYRAAYACENSMASTVWAAASRLRNDAKVSAWIAAAHKACLGSTALTLDDHLRQLERLRELALEKGNIGAAVLAEHHRGKAKGHYVDQVRDVTDHDPQRTLLEIAQHSPELAEQLARANNIPLPARTDAHADTRH
jgi:phage terminase small subunit